MKKQIKKLMRAFFNIVALIIFLYYLQKELEKEARFYREFF